MSQEGEATAITILPSNGGLSDSHELVMAWAQDINTGALRYILELGVHQRGANSGCQCINCNLPLTAVNAAKSTYKRRPHFRHPVGAPKNSCLVLVARAAIRHALQPGDFIELPRRRRSVRVEGLSGNFYEAWVERASETVRITSVHFKDSIGALLVLDDGRQLEVQLIGSAELSEDADIGIIPRVLISVDDPAIAGMPPEEVRRRLVPLLKYSMWCGHWEDHLLDQQARKAAFANAEEELDWETEYADLSADLRRESLLHREVKAILESARRLCLPGWVVKDDRGHHRYSNEIRTPATTAILRDVKLEHRLGKIIPDVVAYLATGGVLLIEVTVTNHITPERLARIRDVNLPTLEIDISRMGGRITREQLALLVIEEVAGKVWLHHPEFEAQRQALFREVDANLHEQLEYSNGANRTAIFDVPQSEWAKRYLLAVQIYSDLRFEEVLSDNEEYKYELKRALAEVMECGLALREYGFPEAIDERLYDRGHTIIDRLLSIKLDTGVGYNLATAWQVINAILQDVSPASKSWHSLYLIAIKAYNPKLSSSQKTRVEQWRKQVRQSIEAEEELYFRNPIYDNFLAILFPDMREALANPFGKINSQHGLALGGGAKNNFTASASADKYSNTTTKLGDDYFEGVNQHRWIWVPRTPEVESKIRNQLERLIRSGTGEAAQLTLQAVTSYAMSADPYSFAQTLSQQYRLEKARTLRYLFSLKLIAPKLK